MVRNFTIGGGVCRYLGSVAENSLEFKQYFERSRQHLSSLETTNLCLSDISKSLRARTLSEKTVLALQDWGSRDFLNFKGDQDGEASQAYRNGLADGATLTSQFVIGRMKEEND